MGLLQEAAERHRRAGALLSSNAAGEVRSCSYPEFWRHCEQYARGLQQMGVRPGDRVAYTRGNGGARGEAMELFTAYFAVPMCGAVLVALHPGWAEEERQWMLAKSGARWVDPEPALLPGAELPPVDPEAEAMVFFSSGSTAMPQLATFTHRVLARHAEAVATMSERQSGGEGKREERTDLHAIGLFHANGWGFPHACTLLGSTQVVLERFSAHGVWPWLESGKVTHSYLVPTMARRLLQEERKGAVREILLGGEVTPRALLQALQQRLGGEAYGGYGLTEAGPTVANAKGCARTEDLGRPLAGVETEIVVEEKAKGEGELRVRTPFACQEWAGRWIPTGDLVSRNSDGSLRFAGRTKEIIVRGGEKISARRTEEVLLGFPGVSECAVVARPDEFWGETAEAIVYLPGRRPNEELQRAIGRYLEGRLAKFQMPARVVVREEPLPKGPTGKILKRML